MLLSERIDAVISALMRGESEKCGNFVDKEIPSMDIKTTPIRA
ncbi:Uncharacterised protein [Janthinobacterium lividum]|nr:Uncharacterised protein [Janthinobacterium lividum]